MNQQNLSHFYIILFSTFYFHKITDDRSYNNFTFFFLSKKKSNTIT